MNKFKTIFLCLLVLGIYGASYQIFAQLNPQANPFGTRGDQALGSFGSNVLTILQALGFWGGIGCVFWTGINIATNKPWITSLLGAIIGLGGWTAVGAIAYQLGSNQSFNIPGIS